MQAVRLGALAAALLALSACGGGEEAAKAPPLPPLKTITVAADGGNAARGWDGVVEAVRQADLTAQTAGRVTQVLADVNSNVAAGSVLVRLSAVEQQAGANTARAQLRAAGFTPVPVALPELLKGGGAIKCCTLELYR